MAYAILVNSIEEFRDVTGRGLRYGATFEELTKKHGKMCLRMESWSAGKYELFLRTRIERDETIVCYNEWKRRCKDEQG